MKQLIRRIFSNKKVALPEASRVLLTEETNKVFGKYQKTLLDLARYDRGEKISTH